LAARMILRNFCSVFGEMRKRWCSGSSRHVNNENHGEEICFTGRIIGVYRGFGCLGGARLGQNSFTTNRPAVNRDGHGKS
jgi:hypothetical protein